MAHELFFDNDTQRHSFFSVKEKAWHRLGTILQDHPTSAEAIQYAGLDFTVEKRELFIRNQDTMLTELVAGQGIALPYMEVPNFYATVRTDKNIPLGIVGKDYHVVQNRNAFAFFDSIVDNSRDIRYETAGCLGNGERIFITAKLPDYIRIGDSDDVIEQYLFFTTSHDGTGSVTIALTPVRIVCANTLNHALRNCTHAVRVRHTASADQQLQDAFKVMEMHHKTTPVLQELFTHWSKVRITDREVRRLIEMAMANNPEVLKHVIEGNSEALSTRFKNTCNEVYSYAMANETQQMETTKGTVFGVYNGVTGYFQHVRKYGTPEDKVKNILLGGTAFNRAQQAFDLCLNYAKHGTQVLQLN
ncbi:DUF932 domain-containing protein [Olivibacter jilunii]|uniref:DUF932 domain-containing protein n=1 Tax=Olivibacter jilunii TaxID=985016 RepID=UPI0010300893|nr:DUF932 domain-containing protein [Olivibacter jilunii]